MKTHRIDSPRYCFALKLAATHLGINILVAILVAMLIMLVWYPHPYDNLMDGLRLLLLIVVVDVVCGPVLTLVLANPKKSRRELTLDLSLVVMVQVAALLYGLHAVAVARPVVVAFEVDRFTVVSAAQIDASQLPQAPAGLQSLSWWGVKRIALRGPKDSDEQMQSLDMSLQGVEPSARPAWWLPDEPATRQDAIARMRPVADLLAHYPNDGRLSHALSQTGLPQEAIYFLPLTSEKNKEWVVLLDKQAEFKSFAPIDGFDVPK